MGLNIVKGKQRTAARVVIYGTEGIGKSTLASQFPKPLILDTEDGTAQIDCDRVVCHDAIGLEGAIQDLVRDPQGYKTVVVDSADWAERQAIDHLLKKAGKRSIEDFGFGKGYVMLSESIALLLAAADQLIARGINVVFVAHSKVQRTSPPDQDEGFDRYELKLTKHSAPLFKEWCDLLLFCNYRTILVEGQDGRMKAKGGKERIMYAQRAAAWDAKNRFGLPESMPMDIASLAALFAGPDATKAQAPRSWRDRVREATTVDELGRISDDADRALSANKLTVEKHGELVAMIDVRHNEIEPQEATA